MGPLTVVEDRASPRALALSITTCEQRRSPIFSYSAIGSRGEGGVPAASIASPAARQRSSR